MKPEQVIADMTATIVRLKLDVPAMAAYVGVPVSTLVKWLNGSRKPTSSAVRLLAVLGLVEALAPVIHAHLIERKEGSEYARNAKESNAGNLPLLWGQLPSESRPKT
ncbi:hypothetical protein KGP36_03945 [Patescibacteria group bacterium]|nr:hypothetical protein [Patescibacteria group bacterium]